jgi:hypothetical protein
LKKKGIIFLNFPWFKKKEKKGGVTWSYLAVECFECALFTFAAPLHIELTQTPKRLPQPHSLVELHGTRKWSFISRLLEVT